MSWSYVATRHVWTNAGWCFWWRTTGRFWPVVFLSGFSIILYRCQYYIVSKNCNRAEVWRWILRVEMTVRCVHHGGTHRLAIYVCHKLASPDTRQQAIRLPIRPIRTIQGMVDCIYLTKAQQTLLATAQKTRTKKDRMEQNVKVHYTLSSIYSSFI